MFWYSPTKCVYTADVFCIPDIYVIVIIVLIFYFFLEPCSFDGIGVTYEGYQYPPPTFWTGGTVPPLLRTQVENLLSSEAICGDQITLKPFSAGARRPGPHHQRAHVLSRFPSMRSLREGLKRCDARSLCHNLFLSTLVLLSFGTITLTYFTISESESECKCLTCNQKPTRSQFSLLYCISIRIQATKTRTRDYNRSKFALNFWFVGLLFQVVLSDTSWFWTLL